MNKQTANPPCPCCGKPMRPAEGVRGTNPDYRVEKGWRCSSGYACDMVGHLLFADTLADPARIEQLAQYNRDSRFVQMIRAIKGKS